MGVIISALAAWLWAALRSKIFWLLVVVVMKDFVYGFIADLLGMAVNAINSVGFNLPSLSQTIGILPVDVLKAMKRVGVDNCLSLIVTAYTVRASLRLFGLLKGLKPRT